MVKNFRCSSYEGNSKAKYNVFEIFNYFAVKTSVIRKYDVTKIKMKEKDDLNSTNIRYSSE